MGIIDTIFLVDYFSKTKILLCCFRKNYIEKITQAPEMLYLMIFDNFCVTNFFCAKKTPFPDTILCCFIFLKKQWEKKGKSMLLFHSDLDIKKDAFHITNNLLF